jgi:hypothetical protein
MVRGRQEGERTEGSGGELSCVVKEGGQETERER